MNKYGQAEYAYGDSPTDFRETACRGNSDRRTTETAECAKQRGLLSSVLHSFSGVISVGLMIPIFKKKWYCM